MMTLRFFMWKKCVCEAKQLYWKKKHQRMTIAYLLYIFAGVANSRCSVLSLFYLPTFPSNLTPIYLLFSCCRKLPKEKKLTHDMIWLFCAVSINHILDKRSRFPWQSWSTLLQIHHRSFKALIETGIMRLFLPNQENFHFIVFGFRIYVTFSGRLSPSFLL